MARKYRAIPKISYLFTLYPTAGPMPSKQPKVGAVMDFGGLAAPQVIFSRQGAKLAKKFYREIPGLFGGNKV